MSSRRLAPLLVVPVVVGILAGVGWASFRPAGDEVRLESEDVAQAWPTAMPTPSAEPTPSYDADRANEVAIDPDDDGDDTDGDAEPEDAESDDDADANATPDPSDEPTEDEPDYDVEGVQTQLSELGYYAAGVDGAEGPGTVSAIMAFQKVHGLTADGVVGPATLAALADPQAPSLQGGADDRIEVDLDRQILHFVQDGAVERIMPISSGDGASYATADGGTAQSLTPVGTYQIERRIRGEREAELGTLYDPLYFHKGWAIHGSNSVPAYPASHGCIRVTRADALWLFERAPDGIQVVLHGGTHTFARGEEEEEAGTSTPAGDTAADAEPVPEADVATDAPAPEETAPPTDEAPAPSAPEIEEAPAAEEPAPSEEAPEDPASSEEPVLESTEAAE